MRELARHLGCEKIDIAGHDVGATVAYSFAANHADAVRKIALLDVMHPHEGFERLSLLPRPGQRVNPGAPKDGLPYPWWYAFNQLRDLPERLLSGRTRYLVDWLLDYGGVGLDVIDDHDRAVYASAYSDPDAIRAGNGWYRAFRQGIVEDLWQAGHPHPRAGQRVELRDPEDRAAGEGTPGGGRPGRELRPGGRVDRRGEPRLSGWS